MTEWKNTVVHHFLNLFYAIYTVFLHSAIPYLGNIYGIYFILKTAILNIIYKNNYRKLFQF